jgi:uncharacterized delta-60 repeat protein
MAAPFTFPGGSYPGGGTCTGTLISGASCTVVVHFAPSSVASFSDTLRIQFFNGLATQTSTRPIAGNGVLASLTVSGSPTYDFSFQVPNSTTIALLTVTNGGGGAASSISLTTSPSGAFSFTGTGYPGTNGTCTNTLAAAGTCKLEVQFTPTATGPYSSSLAFSYFDGLQSQSVSLNLKGTGVLALLTITGGPTFDFGSQFIATSVDHTFTITNAGGAPAVSMAAGTTEMGAPFTFKGGTYPGTGGTCTDTLASGSTCTVVATFAPTTSGVFNDTLTVGYSDSITSATLSLPIKGTGITVAALSISDGATYNYGTQYASSNTDHTFTLTNFGGFTASAMSAGSPAFTAVYSFKGGSYPGTGGTCTATLAPAANCTIVVTFNSSSAGTFSDTVRVGYNDGENPQTSLRAVTGKAVIPAVLSFSGGSTFNFGTHASGSSTDQTITVTNTGPISATSLALAVGPANGFGFKGGSYPGTGGSCATSLASAATCNLVITFAPSAAGSPSSSVDLSYNDGVNTVDAVENYTALVPAGGTLDVTFANGGILTSQIGTSDDYGRAVAIQPDGKIVAAGYSSSSGVFKFAVARYTTSGSADATLNTNGHNTVAFGTTDDRAYGVALQADGKIVVAGYSDLGAGIAVFALARFGTDGSLDNTWGNGGKVTTSFGSNDARAQAVYAQSDGSVVAAGYYDQGGGIYEYAMARYTSSGSLDANFGSAGKVLTPIGSGTSLAYGLDEFGGQIALAGYSDAGSGAMQWALARYTSAGQLDTTFNTTGVATLPIGSGDSRAFAVRFQTDGKLVAGGYTQLGAGSFAFAIGRFTTAGGLDGAFAGGTVAVQVGSLDSRPFALAVQGNGAIVAGGYGQVSGSDYEFAMVRYTGGGSSDGTFAGGVFTTNPSNASDKIYALAIDSGMRLVGVGEAFNGVKEDFGLLRVWP